MTVETERKWRIAEDIFIPLAILAIWPTILGWEGIVFKGLQWVVLVGLAIILVRRIKRIKRSMDG